MKKLSLLILFIFVIIPGYVSGQDIDKSDMVLGKWLTEKKKAHFEVYKEGDKYFGKIVWLKKPNDKDGVPKTDKKNPDPKLRSRPVLNLVLLKDFNFKKPNTWVDGTIYDPEKGKTYSCKMTLDSPDVLKIRGFIGISLLGRTTTWTRVKGDL